MKNMNFHKIPLGLLLVSLTLATIFHHSKAQNSNQNILDAHNSARSSVGVADMAWNTTLAAYAQNYANSRVADNCNLIPSNGPYGENLAKLTALTGTGAVSMWLTEGPYYTYASNTCATGKVCSHYTQVVWANSGQLGCYRALCNGGANIYIVVCSYSAKGNVVGEWPY